MAFLTLFAIVVLANPKAASSFTSAFSGTSSQLFSSGIPRTEVSVRWLQERGKGSYRRDSVVPFLSEETVTVPEGEKNDNEETFEKVEKLGRGSAKAKRGKRKSGGSDKQKKVAASLVPEEVFYEGPPAITETIIPTISILTVVGIIPAAASWARQAWVRYRITTRRIRVTSGIGGNEMAEIVYPDIVELRTVKRLFGDGDMVAFLRDGAKFEMRNIPNFDDTVEFILKQVDKDVAKKYREKGDVTNQ